MDWQAIVVGFVGKYPVVASVLVGMGFFRVLFKPLFTFLRAVADATPTQKDNEILDAAEKSGAYKAAAFALDWLGSIKLPGVK